MPKGKGVPTSHSQRGVEGYGKHGSSQCYHCQQAGCGHRTPRYIFDFKFISIKAQPKHGLPPV